MTDKHDKGFFGQKVGLVVISPAKTKSFIFIQCIRKKSDGQWEKTSKDEGRKVRISLEEMVVINQVLKRKENEWNGYHPYKDRDPNLSVSWETNKKEKLWFNIGKYKKPIEFPQLEILPLLFKHLIKEKIEFATISSSIPSKNKVTTTEVNCVPDLEIKQKISPIEVKIEKVEHKNRDPRKIKGSIKAETEKALLIIFQNGKEIWIPKSMIYSKFDSEGSKEQEFFIDNWVLTQNRVTASAAIT